MLWTLLLHIGMASKRLRSSLLFPFLEVLKMPAILRSIYAINARDIVLIVSDTQTATFVI